jgi:hypothetical protein
MADGYGFGAEGDWKSCGLVRALKVMASGRPGGVSFMEDYTYHLVKGKERVLGAHMLEVCPSIAASRPSLSASRLLAAYRPARARLSKRFGSRRPAYSAGGREGAVMARADLVGTLISATTSSVPSQGEGQPERAAGREKGNQDAGGAWD